MEKVKNTFAVLRIARIPAVLGVLTALSGCYVMQPGPGPMPPGPGYYAQPAPPPPPGGYSPQPGPPPGPAGPPPGP